jgi:hypothetical protein
MTSRPRPDKHRIGPIAAGKLADLAIPGNMTMPAHHIPPAKAVTPLPGGNTAHGVAGFSP